MGYMPKLVFIWYPPPEAKIDVHGVKGGKRSKTKNGSKTGSTGSNGSKPGSKIGSKNSRVAPVEA